MNFEWRYIFIYLVVSFVFGAFTMNLSIRKGYGEIYFGTGFFFGMIGLLYVGFLPPKEKKASTALASLKELNGLYQQEAISGDEYDMKIEEILNRL